ncbi:hypothetical protein BD311DRAFT_218200 [Dichomitus squalens]|uniref:Uncharacterized protein n=1 Tax=Dichomitus squalens TaxID=114155 RepID=A0A4V2K0W7_9APHY|nr:hypothetical protein BD311DRAFT_218200 [Dichomitus squalens]
MAVVSDPCGSRGLIYIWAVGCGLLLVAVLPERAILPSHSRSALHFTHTLPSWFPPERPLTGKPVLICCGSGNELTSRRRLLSALIIRMESVVARPRACPSVRRSGQIPCRRPHHFVHGSWETRSAD